jgi:hypothetical protein
MMQIPPPTMETNGLGSATRQCHKLGGHNPTRLMSQLDPSPSTVQNRSCLLWRCQTTETMVHGPEPDLLLAIPAVRVCYRECSPIKTLRHTQLVHACKPDSARVVKDSAGGHTKYPWHSQVLIPCSVTVMVWSAFVVCVRVFQLDKVEVRFHPDGNTPLDRFLVLLIVNVNFMLIAFVAASFDLTSVTCRPGWSTWGTILAETQIHRMARVDMNSVSLQRLTCRRFGETFLDR